MKIIHFNQTYYSNIPQIVENDIILCPHPWLAFKKGLNRLLCHIAFSPKANNKIKMPFKKYWVKKVLKKLRFNKNEQFVIVINAHYYQMLEGNLIHYVKSINQNNKVLLALSDKVNTFISLYKDFPNMKTIKATFDAVLTYNTNDSRDYGIILDRPCLPCFPKIPNLLGDFESDVFFIGKKKDRLATLHSIYERLTKLGFKCDFYIIDVDDDEKLKDSSIHYNEPLKYQEVLEHCQKTKSILNVVQNSGEGITVRDYEVAFFNKHYITNNFAVASSPLFDRSQIIFLDEIDNRIIEIKKPLPDNNKAKAFNYNNWKSFIESLVK